MADARHRGGHGALTGETAEVHIGFETRAVMARGLSPKRPALLRHVHLAPARSIRARALAHEREDGLVHEDLPALAAAGLLDRDAEGVRAEQGAFAVRMRL